MAILTHSVRHNARLMTVDRASAVPVAFDGFSRGLVLKSGLSSISVENTELGLVHCIGGRLSLNPGPYAIELCCECSLCRRVQRIGFTFLRSLESRSDLHLAAA